MRIGIITYALDRQRTGIGRYTIELLRAMVTLDEQPEIIVLSAGGTQSIRQLGLRCVPLHGSRLLPGLMTLGQLQLPFLVKRLGLDMIHDTTGMSPFFFSTGRTKTVVTLYDVFPLSFPGFSTTWDSLIYRRWLPRMMTQVDCVLTISDTSKADIVKHLDVDPSKIYNVSGGGNLVFGQSRHNSDIFERYQLPEDYILYIGSVEERKNLRRVFEAFAIIRHEVNHKLVIGGPMKWKYHDIMETFRAHDLEHQVIFTGYVDDADLAALYQAADLFVFPSLYEGFGLPVLEAMASGTPVITSNVSSLPEVAGDAALFVDPYNTDAIVAAMRQVLSDADLQQKLRKAGLARASEFTWEQVARKTFQVYEQVHTS